VENTILTNSINMFEIIKSTIEFLVKNIDKYLSEKDYLPLFKNVVQILINSICQEIISNNINRLDLNPKNIYELIGYLNKLLTLAQKIQTLQGSSNSNNSELLDLVNKLKSVMNQGSSWILSPSSQQLGATPPLETTTQTSVQIGVEITSISGNSLYYTINSIIVTTRIFEKYTYPETPTTLISSTIEYPNTYQFPSGYNTLNLLYTFFNTVDQSNQITGQGIMDIGSTLTVGLGDSFSQTFTELTSGQSYRLDIPYLPNINADNTFVYYVSSLDTFLYTAP